MRAACPALTSVCIGARRLTFRLVAMSAPKPAALAILLSAAVIPAARSEPVSPWVREGAAALRLVDAGAGARAGERLAAITIALDPGWKTYWRQPGASGVPPRFDFSGSTNVAEARVAFPAPERSDAEDGVTNVYHGEVTLPVVVTPRDPSAPVELRLVADYGVCEAVCVPVRAEAALELAPDGSVVGPAAEEARRAALATPKAQPVGAQGGLSVLSVRRGPAASTGPTLDIRVAAPDGEAPALFAETGAGDYAPAPAPLGPGAFRMTFDEPELPGSGLRLTLAAGGRAVETVVALDEIAAAH